MSKRKEPPKPIFPLKHDFYASLDHLLQEVMMLHQTCSQLIELGKVEGASAEILRERVEAVRKAMSEDF